MQRIIEQSKEKVQELKTITNKQNGDHSLEIEIMESEPVMEVLDTDRQMEVTGSYIENINPVNDGINKVSFSRQISEPQTKTTKFENSPRGSPKKSARKFDPLEIIQETQKE